MCCVQNLMADYKPSTSTNRQQTKRRQRKTRKYYYNQIRFKIQLKAKKENKLYIIIMNT